MVDSQVSKPNKENIQKWIIALRSGGYEQGIGGLKWLDGRYCCLGVACEVYKRETGRGIWLDESCYFKCGRGVRDISSAILPDPVADWLGLGVDPLLSYDGQIEGTSCTVCNDTKKLDFNLIADLIERTYLNQ